MMLKVFTAHVKHLLTARALFPRVDRKYYAIHAWRRHMTSVEKCDVTLKCIVLCGAAAAQPNFGRCTVVTSCHSTIAPDAFFVMCMLTNSFVEMPCLTNSENHVSMSAIILT